MSSTFVWEHFIFICNASLAAVGKYESNIL